MRICQKTSYLSKNKNLRVVAKKHRKATYFVLLYTFSVFLYTFSVILYTLNR